MLRITVHEDARCLTVQLEGRLAGLWVQELEEFWKRTMATQQEPIVRVDLAGVTFIDDAGKSCLAAMHRQGAKFVGGDCLIKAIIEEVCQS